MSELPIAPTIINTYDQMKQAHSLRLPPVSVIKKHHTGRSTGVNGVAVWHLGHQTDPEAHWTDNGMKVFSLFNIEGNDHRSRLAAAFKCGMDWASEKYGVKEWEKNRMGDYVPAPLNSTFPLRKRTRTVKTKEPSS